MAVEVIGQIQIKNNSTLPVVDQSRIAGGMGWVVADLPARDAIPMGARKTAMEVKVIDAGGAGTKYYSLDATLLIWTEIVSTGFIPTSQKGAANGVATLDSGGFIPAGQIKNLFLNDSFIFADQASMLAATTTTGNFATRSDTGDVWVKLNNNGPPSVIGDWSVLSSPGVATVNGLAGGVSIDFDILLSWGSSATQFETGITNSAYIAGIDAAISTLQGQVGAGTDSDAIHDNVTGEINAVTSKTTPVGADLVLIEDSAASFGKKKISVSDIWNASGAYWNTTGDTTITSTSNIKGAGTASLLLGTSTSLLNSFYVNVNSNIIFQVFDANTVNSVSLLDLNHSSTGTAAVGFGGAIRIGLENDSGGGQPAFALDASWLSAVAGSEETEVTMRSYKDGASVDFFKYSTLTSQVTFPAKDGSSNTILTPFEIQRDSSVAGASNIGVDLKFKVKDDTSLTDIGGFTFDYRVVATASRDARFRIQLADSGTIVDAFSINTSVGQAFLISQILYLGQGGGGTSITLAAAGGTNVNINLLPKGTGSVIFVGTGSLITPIGTTAQRPSTPAAGMFRLNSTTSKMEFYTGSGWETVTSV